MPRSRWRFHGVRTIKHWLNPYFHFRHVIPGITADPLCLTRSSCGADQYVPCKAKSLELLPTAKVNGPSGITQFC
jgi:hypothetical protein